MINVLVNGAFGRMGQLTTKAITAHPRLNLVGETSRGYELEKAIRDSSAQVVVDFTRPEIVFENAQRIIKANAHPVIGTSGLTQTQIIELQKECARKKLGGIIAPNFSLGAVLMMKYAVEISQYMPTVEIIETHHPGKIDSPSGTAIRTAELIAAAAPHINQPPHQTSETLAGARGTNYKNINIHSVRLPGHIADQQVVFGNTGETLQIMHATIDRECFMPGVCFACEKVVELEELVLGLEKIL